MLPCWSCSDGEENVGDQEFFDNQQDQQEFGYMHMGYMHMGSLLALNITVNDLHIEQ